MERNTCAQLLRFACRDSPRSLLDLGCGTGNLLRAAAEAFPRSSLFGIDLCVPFVDRARATTGPPFPNYAIGRTEELPFADNVFHHCLSLLLLQEIQDRAAALREMHRVTQEKGIVAACQWDFENGMPMIAALREALVAVAPAMHDCARSGSARAFTGLQELETAWRSAGLEDVETARIPVTLSYVNFADLWSPVLAGSTPTTALVAALPGKTREAVGRKLYKIIPAAHHGCAFSLTAHAFAIRGRASQQIQARES